MKLLMWNRGSGKTTALLAEMAKDPQHSILLTHNADRADSVYRDACDAYPDIEWNQDHFLSFHAASYAGGLMRGREPGQWHLYVDELGLIVSQMLGTGDFTASWDMTGTEVSLNAAGPVIRELVNPERWRRPSGL